MARGILLFPFLFGTFFFYLSCITIAMRERIGSIDLDLIITH